VQQEQQPYLPERCALLPQHHRHGAEDEAHGNGLGKVQRPDERQPGDQARLPAQGLDGASWRSGALTEERCMMKTPPRQS
jgi:hypothetical protein